MENSKTDFNTVSNLICGAFILLCLSCFSVEAAFASYKTLGSNFRNFTSQNGLADNMVLCIYKDTKGFMWFGTNCGLSKYDGKSFYNYAVKADFNVSVSKIAENGKGVLFLLSNDWITLFDCQRECVRPLVTRKQDGNCQFTDFALINDSVMLACDAQTFMHIEVSGLSTEPDARITGMCQFPLKRNEIFVRFCLLPDKQAFYAVTNYGRVMLVDRQSMRIKKETQLPNVKSCIGISSIAYYNQNLWITSMADGIFIYDRDLQQADHLMNSSTQHSLSHNDVYSVCSLPEGTYIATTWFGYTVVYKDAEKQSWTTDIVQQMPYDINIRMISSYYDPAGILWVGTHGGGIIMVDLRWNFYKRYEQECDNETEYIIADNEGNAYLSTYHKGIMRSVDLYAAKEQNFRFEPIAIQGVSATFLCAAKDKKGQLWFGNKDGNVVCYDPAAGAYKVYDVFNSLNVSVNSLFIDESGQFWVGTSGGLFLLDSDFARRQEVVLDSTSTSVFDIKEDCDHHLWIATGVGVYYLKREAGSREVTKCLQTQPANTAQCILVASDGHVYVGFKNGLGVIHKNTKHFSTFLTTANGLISNWINCIAEGPEGGIWIGTNSGITRYDHNSMCYNYFIPGGTRSVANMGEFLLWGGSKQVMHFDPREAVFAFESSYHSKVYITNLEIGGKRINTGENFNQQIILQRQIAYTDALTLNYANRNFALSFSNCSYSYGMQKYEYRLYPYQKEWTICNDGEGVSYANLSAGNYTFQVRTIYPGKFNGEITDLNIVILPHWSQTWVFRSILLLCLVAILVYLVQKFRKQQRRRERMLCLEHDLNIANMLKEQEINMSREREQLFVQVAHELRTPLTLIIAPLGELLLSADKNNGFYSKLSFILMRAKSMQSLINQLLHVQKIKTGMLKLSISKVAMRDVVERSILSFKEFAIQQQIDLSIAIEHDAEVYIDVEKIESAINNLLSNAFKYTPAGGRIVVAVHSSVYDENRYCCVQVSDTGTGIAPVQQEHIFDSFTTGNQVPNHSTAVGVGLYIVKNVLELHHGFVRLESEVGRGSSFTLCIPEGKEHFTGEYTCVCESAESVPEDKAEIIVPERTPASTPGEASVLVVEDNWDVRTYIVSLFSEQYRVYEACNGEDGVQQAKQYLPDLIISDVMMPVMDGLALSRELKSNGSTCHIPIIMLTAKADDADVIAATRFGIDDYLTKPFNAGVLRAKVGNLLWQRKQLKSLYSKSLNLHLSDTASEPDGDEAFMQQVIHVIESNLTNATFNAKTLAGLFHMSQPTLYRKIKDNCQLSIIEVIRNVRITKAASLLLLKKHSVQEVCELVGYNDYDTFRKHFVAQFKVAPSKYESTVAKE